MIPGSKPKFDVFAKVRIGKKIETKSGKEVPTSLDYFVSEAAAFAELEGQTPRRLLIRFVHPVCEDAFSTGLEWWRGKQLTCYTKGDGKALRVQDQVTPEDTVLRTDVGNRRTEIVCPARECQFFKSKQCKPMGRLVFVLESDPQGRVFQIDTHSWNSIEKIEGTLSLASTRGDLRGRMFELSVEMQSKGSSKFPVLSLAEVAPVLITNDKDVTVGDALIRLTQRMDEQSQLPYPADRNQAIREALAEYLDATRPGWRDEPAVIARIREVGALAAIDKILRQM